MMDMKLLTRALQTANAGQMLAIARDTLRTIASILSGNDGGTSTSDLRRSEKDIAAMIGALSVLPSTSAVVDGAFGQTIIRARVNIAGAVGESGARDNVSLWNEIVDSAAELPERLGGTVERGIGSLASGLGPLTALTLVLLVAFIFFFRPKIGI